MELLRRSNVLDRGRVKEALRVVFARRKTHEPPEALTPPPAAWEGPFRAMAAECGLPGDIHAAFEEIRDFWKSVR